MHSAAWAALLAAACTGLLAADAQHAQRSIYLLLAAARMAWTLRQHAIAAHAPPQGAASAPAPGYLQVPTCSGVWMPRVLTPACKRCRFLLADVKRAALAAHGSWEALEAKRRRSSKLMAQ